MFVKNFTGNMTNIYAYLTFNGNCRQAMQFYKKCLGGKLVLQTIGESPMADKLPSKMKKNILHSTLTKKGLVMMGSDMVGESGLIKGNAVSLMLNCASEKDIRDLYEKLATGGKPTHPIENTFWGALFGGLTDPFGNHWLLHFDKKEKK